MTIKNIIFDLGGVIIDIDFKRTFKAFHELNVKNFEVIFSHAKQDKIFDMYDVGKITSKTFRSNIQDKLNIKITDEDFDKAWNALIIGIPKERLDFIKDLRKQYKIFLFSNTNEIHLAKVFNVCKEQHGIANFKDYFDKEYYSHIFGQRKPNVEAFKDILNENKILPHETLFIDDSTNNLQGAAKAGLHTMHIADGKSIFDILEFIKEINNLT